MNTAVCHRDHSSSDLEPAPKNVPIVSDNTLRTCHHQAAHDLSIQKSYKSWDIRQQLNRRSAVQHVGWAAVQDGIIRQSTTSWGKETTMSCFSGHLTKMSRETQVPPPQVNSSATDATSTHVKAQQEAAVAT